METKNLEKIGNFFGELISFNTSLKLYHWHVTGPASYAQHMALDQAIDSLTETTDGFVETSYALYGDISITVPATKLPQNIVKHSEDFYNYVEKQRDLFTESFSGGLFDTYQEAIQQLLYRLKRLS